MTTQFAAITDPPANLRSLIDARTADEWLTATEGQPRFLVEGLLHASTTLVYGLSESGKSWLMVDLVRALTTGTDWLGQPIHGGPRRCLILASDTDGLVEYAQRLGHGYGDAVRIAKPPHVDPDVWVGLAGAAAAERVDVAVIDNLYAWAGAVDMNANAEVARPLGCLRALTATGIAVVLVHHTNSSGRTPAGVHAIQAFFRHSLHVKLHQVRAHGNDAGTAIYPLRRDGGRVLGLGQAAKGEAPDGVADVKAGKPMAAERHQRALTALKERPDLTGIRRRGTHLHEVMHDVASPESGRAIVKALIEKGLLQK